MGFLSIAFFAIGLLLIGQQIGERNSIRYVEKNFRKQSRSDVIKTARVYWSFGLEGKFWSWYYRNDPKYGLHYHVHSGEKRYWRTWEKEVERRGLKTGEKGQKK